ncbi:MAG: TlpA disulfide reductase family protein [bacterium]|nr:TlpA disulfide reductase family protein [bacterium]MDT8367205.1 TlpA disulfide reductase family protein [bacterium]
MKRKVTSGNGGHPHMFHPNSKTSLMRIFPISFILIPAVIGALLFTSGDAVAANLAKGDQAPAWPPLADMAGEVRSLEDHLGKNVVMLDFWSIYCVSCIQEMPSLVALYDKYKDKGLVTYGIDLDSFSPRRVEKFIKGLNFEITYPVIIDQKREIATAFKVGMLPTTIIIGKDGKVKLFHIGYKPGDEDEFDHLIKSLLE